MLIYVNLLRFCISVGATVQEPTDFCYLYENADEFAVLPTFYVSYAPVGCMSSSITQDALPHTHVDPTQV